MHALLGSFNSGNWSDSKGMIARENVPKQQHHPDLRDGGHASAHDPHPSPRYAPGKVLPWNA